MVIKSLSGTFNFLLFTSIYIAFVAIGMVHQTALLFDINLSFSFYAFVFAGTLCSYNFHWYFTHVTDDSEISLKTGWHIRYRNVHLAIAVAAFVVAVVFAFSLLEHWLWLAFSALFTFLYSAPKVPLSPFTKLRQIAYGKTIFLALAWMHVTTMLPLLVQQVDWQMPHYLFALNRFFLIYAICILFDLRDRDSDRLSGIKSMITQMSITQVTVIYYGILFFWAIITGWLSLYLSPAIILAFSVPGLVLLFIYHWAKRQENDYLYYFFLDGLMVISFPLMLLFQI